MVVINEESTVTVTLSFYNEDDEGVQPDSGSYRIDDILTGEEITEDTDFIPTDVTHEITISHAENAILDDNRSVEDHRLTVTFIYATTKHGSGHFDFRVKNLSAI